MLGYVLNVSLEYFARVVKQITPVICFTIVLIFQHRDSSMMLSAAASVEIVGTDHDILESHALPVMSVVERDLSHRTDVSEASRPSDRPGWIFHADPTARLSTNP